MNKYSLGVANEKSELIIKYIFILSKQTKFLKYRVFLYFIIYGTQQCKFYSQIVVNLDFRIENCFSLLVVAASSRE